jgi:hypothetical protein
MQMACNTLPQDNYWYGFASGAAQSVVQQLPWEKLSQDLIKKFKVNGMRVGQRSRLDAQQLYDMRIPYPTKILGEPAVRQFLNGKDASHIKSHINGGTGNADNIIFEYYKSNRSRGSKNIKQSEFLRIQTSNQFEFLRSKLFYKKIGMNTAKGVFYGALFSASNSAFTNIWNAIDNEVSWEEAAWNILNDAKDGAIAGGIAGLGFTILAFTCPPVGVIVGAFSPLLGLLGVGATSYNLIGFAVSKLFPKEHKVSLLLKPKMIEILKISKPIKILIPPKLEIYAPKIEIPKIEIFIPEKHPLVYNLENE